MWVDVQINAVGSESNRVVCIQRDLNRPSEKTIGEELRYTRGEMAMRCPSCGRDNGEGVRFCQWCGAAFVPPVTFAPSVPYQYPPSNKDNNTVLIAIAVIVVILAVIGVVVLASLLSPEAHLRADLSFSASNDNPGLAGSGSISVSGVIYNYGISDVDCDVHLRVFDGYVWHDFDVLIGVVHAGGEHWLSWSANFDPMDANNVQVEHTLIVR